MNVGRVRLTATPRSIAVSIDHERPGDAAVLTLREAAVLRDELGRLLSREAQPEEEGGGGIFD